jgi:hypothetical protein
VTVTRFDFEKMPNSDVLIQFFSDDGQHGQHANHETGMSRQVTLANNTLQHRRNLAFV